MRRGGSGAPVERDGRGHIVPPVAEFEQLLELAAGAALARRLPMSGDADEAADDIRNLRPLLGCMRLAKRTAVRRRRARREFAREMLMLRQSRE